MASRRSKVIPGPLLYPEKAPATAHVAAPPAATASKGTTREVPPTTAAAAATAGGGNAAAPRPRLFRVASPSIVQPSATPMSGAEPFSPCLNVYRGGGGAAGPTSLAAKTRVLVDHHVTNTGAVVRLERVDYSKAMRAYRVCRQEGGGGGHSTSSSGGGNNGNGTTSGSSSSNAAPSPSSSAAAAALSPFGAAANTAAGPANGSAGSPTSATPTNGFGSSSSSSSGDGASHHSPAPWGVVLRRLFGAADMALLAIALACFLVVVSRVRVTSQKGSSSSGGVVPAGASTSGLVSLLGSLVAHYGVYTSAGGAAGDDAARRGALVPAHSTGVASSYSQPTHSASLDTSVTFALLFFSVLLLAKRLSSAVTRVYVEEVLVMRGVGLQFSSYGIFNTLRYKVFVDLQMLRSLVIHDAFFRYQPLFYLSSSVENRAERMVYFPDTLPRLAVLRVVLNGIRGVLYGEPEEGPSLAELEERWKTSQGDLSDEELFTEDSFAEDTMTTPDEGHSSDGTD